VYTLEDRMKAVSLFFKYGGSLAGCSPRTGLPNKEHTKTVDQGV